MDMFDVTINDDIRSIFMEMGIREISAERKKDRN